MKDYYVHEPKPDLIILYSGGTDSRLMLKMALERGRRPLLVYVRYGQHGTHHEHKLNLFKLGVDYREVSVSGVYARFDVRYEDVAEDYIPNRNMILVAIAAAIAEQKGIKRIWLGANISDVENFYPDCTQWWKDQMNEAFVADIELEYPLENLTQEEVIAKLDDNVPKAE